jgi:DNA-binding MarR family transcriptional regulator
MAERRLSKLQRHILRCLFAQYQRTHGVLALEHRALAQTVGHDKGNLSHSLRTLEMRGLIQVGRTPGGKADYVNLTAEGRTMASQLSSSCD